MELTLTTLLSPAQRSAADGVLDALNCGDVILLQGSEGAGKTTVLEAVRDSTGALLVDVRQFMVKLAARDPLAVEEAFVDLVSASLVDHHIVMIDDLHLIGKVTEGCSYPRFNLFDLAISCVLAKARANGQKLVFASDGRGSEPIQLRAYSFAIGEFETADYESICRAYLDGEVVGRLDFARIHRFAPMLNAHQLRKAGLWLSRERGIDTDRFIAYLTSQNLTSNVDIEEVKAVDFRDLKGVDEVLEALETKIALPFENDALAAELQLKPKRGVLLAGPPGTGKTTIGRALAHRLKSKFFLIDGTVIAGTYHFYDEVRRIFDAAKRNAPSIIFIDDADVLFEEKAERGFYRYLLTMLDGLESASSERVCVIMTAMDAASLPEAVLRSGRVELWLETRLPDQQARAEILIDMLSKLPPPFSSADVTRIAASGRGLTGADLKAIIEDGKLLYARDKLLGAAERPVESYFTEAIETIRKNRKNYIRKKPVRLAETVKVGFNIE